MDHWYATHIPLQLQIFSPNKEDFMYKYWFARAHSPTTLKSVIFPQEQPEIDNLFDGHEFAICPRRIEFLKKRITFSWINDYPFTIVIDWG
jgi:hypothetical protein